nr:flavodoxin [Methanothermobacter thermautotrophicus]
MMKTCVIYYSRSGNTAMVARTLAEELNADLIEIRDLDDRKGFMSSFRSSIDALRESKTPIKPEKVDLSGYDLVYLGTPTWAGKPAPAIITLIDRVDFLGKDVILFTTMSRQGGEGAIERMAEKIGARGGRIINFFIQKTAGKELIQVREDTLRTINEKDLKIYEAR